MDSLDREETRVKTVYGGQRAHGRKEFRREVTIRFVERDGAGQVSQYETRVMARDISSGGVGFVYPEELPAGELFVGLPGADGQPAIWFKGSIVRRRPMNEEGFWDFGVKFHGRVGL